MTLFFVACCVHVFGQDTNERERLHRQLGSLSKKDTAYSNVLYKYAGTFNLENNDSVRYYRMVALQGLGDYYSDTHHYGPAQKYYTAALAQASTTGNKIKQAELYRALSLCNEASGDLPGAIANRKQYDALRDSISMEHYKNIRTLEAHYRAEKKQRELTEKNLVTEQEKNKATTRLFWLACAVILLIAVTVFSLQRIRIVKERAQKLKTEQQVTVLKAGEHERNRIARDLHDDVGATLSSIHIYSQAAQMRWREKSEEVHHLITRIGDHSAQMMDKMSDMIWSMSIHQNPAEALILRMKTFASEVLHSKEIQTNFSFDPLTSLNLTMEARKNLLLVFKEAVNIVARYSQAQQAFLSINIEGEDLIMTVKDDGCGFDEQDQVSGDALVNMKHRAAMLEGEISIQSPGGEGNIIALRVPVSKISDPVYS